MFNFRFRIFNEEADNRCIEFKTSLPHFESVTVAVNHQRRFHGFLSKHAEVTEHCVITQNFFGSILIDVAMFVKGMKPNILEGIADKFAERLIEIRDDARLMPRDKMMTKYGAEAFDGIGCHWKLLQFDFGVTETIPQEIEDVLKASIRIKGLFVICSCGSVLPIESYSRSEEEAFELRHYDEFIDQPIRRLTVLVAGNCEGILNNFINSVEPYLPKE